MKASILISALAAFTAVNAAPAAESQGGFTVYQEDAGPRIRYPAVEIAQAYRKYGFEPPENITIAEKMALTGKQGRVTATPEEFDREYTVPIKIGSQNLRLILDTGSSDLWVFSTEQPASQRQGHTAYKCTKNKIPGETWSIKYEDGSGASGNIVKDRVQLGGVTSPNQAVECAKSVSGSFVKDKTSDGIIGFGFNNLNMARPKQVATFFSNVKNGLSAPIFTAALGNHKPGLYTFGFIDGSKHSGSIAYAGVSTRYGVWQFSAGYGVGSAKKGSTSFIADTGTSLILTTAAITKAYYSKVKGARYDSTVGGYVFPCSEAVPGFSIFVGGARRTTPGAYLKYARVDSTYCYGGIQAVSGLPFTILGDTFLSSQYVVFDSRGPRIGFAQQK